MNFKFKSLPENFKIRFELHKEQIHLTERQEADVERVWKEQQQKSLLFDGLLFSVKSVSDSLLLGNWIDYRYMIAQRYIPSLQSTLKILPLGISAVTTCDDSILIGKRGGFLANYPNCYECAPSGGVDPSAISGDEVDVTALIMKELEEEVGLLHEHVQNIDLTSLCFDQRTQAYELIAQIELHRDAMRKIGPSMEYPEIFWIKKSEISAFLNLHKDAILPLTQQLLKRIKESLI